MRNGTWVSSDAGLLVAGLVGLGIALCFACDNDDDDVAEPGSSSSSGGGAVGSSSGGASDVSCSNDPATAANTAEVVAAAEALLATLTDDQRTKIGYDKTLANAKQWSNFPAGVVQRNGVKLGDLGEAAQTAALTLVQAAAGTQGAGMLAGIRGADDAFASESNDSTLFGRGSYYVSIHGTVSTSAPWMLQVAGHHVAYNFTYNGRCTSATPLFDGVQPSTYNDTNGVSQQPLESQRAALGAVFASVASLPGAKLAGTFSDMLNGPADPTTSGGRQGGGVGGAIDSRYPSALTYPTDAAVRGVGVSTLTAQQKALVKTAIEAWVKNVADPVSSSLLATYESDEALAQTYVGYSGATDLSSTLSYGRIDGPRVWIEFTVQSGTVGTAEGHYHTIWRDKIADYGADYVSQ